VGCDGTGGGVGVVLGFGLDDVGRAELCVGEVDAPWPDEPPDPPAEDVGDVDVDGFAVEDPGGVERALAEELGDVDGPLAAAVA